MCLSRRRFYDHPHTLEETKKFLDFASWLKGGGDSEMRESAKTIDGFDADVIEMHSMSLQAKVRTQRKRNYNNIMHEKQTWFRQVLARNGFVKDWF